MKFAGAVRGVVALSLEPPFIVSASNVEVETAPVVFSARFQVELLFRSMFRVELVYALFVSPVMVLYCRKNRLGHNRLGLTVSAKLACAVKRNRIKRLFREAYRLHEDEFATGVDLVLVARARAVGATYQDIEKSLLRALRENKAAAAQP